MDFGQYLEPSKIVDFRDSEVFAKAKELAYSLETTEDIAKACYLFVRDEIRHSGDSQDRCRTTVKASEVLKQKSGWCLAKAILLAALLRANRIPAGFAYQRLDCSEHKKRCYCIHGLNWVYLKDHGWFRIDPRGNKEGVDAQFIPPKEKLAFEIGENEFNIEGNFSSPLLEVVEALEANDTYEKMRDNLPDWKQKG